MTTTDPKDVRRNNLASKRKAWAAKQEVKVRKPVPYKRTPNKGQEQDGS